MGEVVVYGPFHGCLFTADFLIPDLRSVPCPRNSCSTPVLSLRKVRGRSIPGTANTHTFFLDDVLTVTQVQSGFVLRSYCDVVAWVRDPLHTEVAGVRREALHFADVKIARPRTISVERFQHTLLHMILPQVLALRGEVMLHAACVVIDGRAHLFAGPSGIGKSTLAAGFARAGCRVLAEDVVRVAATPGGHYVAYPSYPGARLREGSFLLEGVRKGQRASRLGLPKHRVYWDDTASPLEPVRLGGLHFLARGRIVAPQFEAIAPSLAMTKVLESTFMQALPVAVRARAGFERTLQLLRAVPCDTLRYRRSPAHFEQLLRGIAQKLSDANR